MSNKEEFGKRVRGIVLLAVLLFFFVLTRVVVEYVHKFAAADFMITGSDDKAVDEDEDAMR